ncbi:hypothetical protein [Microterricola viridarii]|uniref:Subtilisin inhibitor-like n=1 Tax=Microterricola viridarii TaxID=412690 RepID=A0A1H1Y2G5_9MICO|nr:hypothetical protein [Microterricola viridarii]SDT15658.1 hypothetical protein SAMN04489834_2958 [Microterricola viridarii]
MNIRTPLLAATTLAASAILTGFAPTGGPDDEQDTTGVAPVPLRITSLCSAPDYVLAQAPEGLCDSLSNEPLPAASEHYHPRWAHGGDAVDSAPLRFTPSAQLCSDSPGSPLYGHRGYRITC